MKLKMEIFPIYINLTRLLGFYVVSVLFIVLLSFCSAVAQDEKKQAEAIGFLSKEKSLGESYASILKEFGKDDIMNYAEGIRLYANAKAEFDGLIEQLKWNLSNNQSLDESSEFKNELLQAAEQRIAFTGFITDVVIADNAGSKNPLALAAIATLPELIKALTDAGKSIWQEFRLVDQEQQQKVLDKLDSAKWVDYSKIAGSG